MKRLIKFLAWSVAAIILGLGIITAVYWSKRTVWPTFTGNGGNEPQLVAHVDHDFGWRTGDRIPISLFIKQPASVEVDVHSIALSGDFELPTTPSEIIVRDTKSGVKYIRVNFAVQSFHVQPKWTMNGNISYAIKGQTDSKSINLPIVELHTSPTWDGRLQLQDGPLAIVQGYHWLITGGCLLFGLVGMIACTLYLRRLAAIARGELKEILSPRQTAKREFVAVWQKVRKGDDSVDNYREMQRIVRTLYRCQTDTVEEIPFVLGDNHPHLKEILIIMENSDRVLYEQAVLSDPEKKAIYNAFNRILKLE